MPTISVLEDHNSANPLDMVEELVRANDWPHERHSSEDMSVEMAGQWCDYHLHFSWLGELAAVHFSCALDLRVPSRKRVDVTPLLALVNERLWVGHFDLVGPEGVPLYRHTMLLRGGSCASVEQFEDLVDAAVGECDRFYPAFQYVVWGGRAAAEALDAAMLETAGEA